LPTAAYGVVLFMAGVAYYVLKTTIIAAQGDDNTALAEAMGRDLKGKISPVIYAVAVPLAFVTRWIALALYVSVALVWLIPDRRIESRMKPA